MTTSVKAPAKGKPAAKGKGKRNLLALARSALVKGICAAEESTRGLYEAYAHSLNRHLGRGWQDVKLVAPLSDADKAFRKLREAEKATFFAMCNVTNPLTGRPRVANPSATWKLVQDWAAGRTKTQQKAKTGAHANAPRVIGKRQTEELSKLYKACVNDEEATEKDLEVNGAIAVILRDLLNVDLSTLVS